MKSILFDIKGEKKGEIEMPVLFNERIKENIVKKWFEVDRFIQPYSSDPKAGRKHSASGTISHKRHDWKGHYGQGRSRIPRKTMSRSGTHFHWVGAEISSARGGRRAHPPKGIGKEKKINKKEIIIAMNSAFAATANKKFIENRYSTMGKMSINVPIVMESNCDNIKSKELFASLMKVFGDLYKFVEKNKEIRAGKGKARGRKYKSNAGLLFVKSKDEKIKSKRIDIKNVYDIRVSDLYPLGRLTVYTEKALVELGESKWK